MTDIDDLLDQRMSGSSGDYPPWFDEEGTEQGEPPIQEDGDVLQGRVTEVRDDPFYDPEKEDEPKPILHVRQDNGNEWSTRTHSVLVSLINKEEPKKGDLVRIQKDGSFKTDNGQVANDYQIGVVRAEELDDLDETSTDGGSTTQSSSGGSTQEPETTEEPETTDEPEPEPEPEDDGFDISEATVAEVEEHVSTITDESVLDDLAMDEMAGKDRKTAKAHIKNRKEELQSGGSDDSDTSDDTDDSSGDEGGEVPGDVIEFAESLISFHGELSLTELDEYLNDTRDFDIDAERAANALGNAEVDGDSVVSTE